ncbi:MAG: SusC/RagA family TonB-linked outer membrane protein [Bacteroidetes bacterium]|nr:SusC/RagA family TonB-linked outer membrane protein [Bacteroidota bacterium]
MKQTSYLKVTGVLFLLLLFSISVFGQTITVHGTVRGPSNTVLVGVIIKVQGSSAGIITDLDGKYSIQIPSSSKLAFSYVGYKTQVIDVAGKTKIDVVLEEDTKLMDEVVVIGYGTIKKSDLTGAVSSADLKSFEKSPNVNIGQSLQGSVPGLNVGQVTSAGETPNITIRGQNTISGGTGVLVVVDGIITGNSLSSLNPLDIASIEVLKDASSTAVYGAQAANGVLLVTTKKGKAGKARVSFSSSYSIQNPTHNYSTMNRAQDLEFMKNLMWSKAYTAASGYTEDNSDFNLFTYNPDNLLSNDDNTDFTTTDYDWWGKCTRTTSIFDNKFNISGGNEDITYLFSLGNVIQKNLLVNDDFRRNTARLNLDAKIRPWWKFGTQLSGSFQNMDGAEPTLWTLYSMNPMVTPYDDDGNLVTTPMNMARSNPLLGSDMSDKERKNFFVGNLYTEIQLPLKGLSYRLNYGNEYNVYNHFQSNPHGNSETGEAYKVNSSSLTYTLDNILTYAHDFGKHSIGGTLVYGVRHYTYEYTKADATEFDRLSLGYNSLTEGTNQYTTSAANSNSSLYQMGRVNYKYNNRYLFTATLRRDGFSGFAKNYKFGYFPSASLGWIMSDESFFKVPAINYMKLRLGYGVSGNLPYNKTNYTNSYTSLSTVNTTGGYVFGDEGSTVMRQELASLANNNLKWERTTGVNVGLDFHLLHDRIQGSLEAYQTTTHDLLFDVSIPIMTGFSSIKSNIGKIRNKGIEFTVTSHNITTKSFNWSTTFNIASNSNKILALNGSDLVGSGLFIGKSLSAIYDYKVDGIYQVADETNGTIPTNYHVGNYKIHDVSGDGSISTADLSVIGKTDPDYRFSILNTFMYKHFTLSFFINSVQGGKNSYLGQNSYTLTAMDNTSMECNHLYEFSKHVWSPKNPDGIYAAYETAGAITPTRYEGRSFVRLQDITLDYSLPKSMISKIGLDNINVYVTGKNLLTFTGWHGWDPEANSGTINMSYVGRDEDHKTVNKSGDDYEGRPVMRSFTFGINFNF